MKRIVILFICVFFATFATGASSGECEIIFLYNPPQGIGQSVELIRDYQFPNKIFPRKTERIHVPNGEHIFEAKIGESLKLLKMDVKDERVSVRIGIRITPSGVKVDTFFINTREVLPVQGIQPRIDSLSKSSVRPLVLIDSSKIYVENGRKSFEKGNYDQAIKKFKRAIQFNRNNDVAYYMLGVSYFNKSDYDNAISIYNQAIKLNPNDADKYINLAIADDTAFANYKKALQINPIFKKILELHEKEQAIEKANIGFEDSLLYHRANEALIRETIARTELENEKDTVRALREAMANADQHSMKIKKRAWYLGNSSIVLGVGAITYGIIQNGSVANCLNKNQFRQAENFAKTRDAAYYIGTTVLLSGILIRITF
jgi:lipoprotein NlpI